MKQVSVAVVSRFCQAHAAKAAGLRLAPSRPDGLPTTRQARQQQRGASLFKETDASRGRFHLAKLPNSDTLQPGGRQRQNVSCRGPIGAPLGVFRKRDAERSARWTRPFHRETAPEADRMYGKYLALTRSTKSRQAACVCGLPRCLQTALASLPPKSGPALARTAICISHADRNKAVAEGCNRQ